MVSENLPLQPPAKELPKRINFDDVQSKKKEHVVTMDKINTEFEEAPKWCGIVMGEQDWLPYYYEDERKHPWSTILHGEIFDVNRKRTDASIYILNTTMVLQSQGAYGSTLNKIIVYYFFVKAKFLKHWKVGILTYLSG